MAAGHLRGADRLGALAARRRVVVSVIGALQLEPAADLEFGDPAHRHQFGDVGFAAEGGDHAGEVADGGDGGADALPRYSRVAARLRSS